MIGAAAEAVQVVGIFDKPGEAMLLKSKPDAGGHLRPERKMKLLVDWSGFLPGVGVE